MVKQYPKKWGDKKWGDNYGGCATTSLIDLQLYAWMTGSLDPSQCGNELCRHKSLLGFLPEPMPHQYQVPFESLFQELHNVPTLRGFDKLLVFLFIFTLW
jgi:hypothetical protein